MRIRAVTAAALCLAALPAFAQSPRDVTGPLTLNGPIVLCTDLPVTSKPVPRMVVRGAHSTDAREAQTGGLVVITRFPDDGLAVGQRYTAARLMTDPKEFPRPGEGYGDVRVTGWMTVKAVDELNALAEIEYACDTIETGDFLEPYTDVVLPTVASSMDVAPDFSDRANFVFGVDRREVHGAGAVVSIDRGTVHGVVSGARYAIYRDKRNGLPLIHLGEAVVLSTSELTSKVMITRSGDSVEPGDVAVPRRQPQ
jgi:hypothetical protein